ncbi:hypothetical protein O8C97_01580 [Aliarcobacter butzleri]|uniref:hypothetical protein n=1 Tax=Aliarcobacter butzleri TaxID=28197 RepID=UPI00263E7C85|nr:hypothetical protein [Aliarcobacter butzleri]MDN5046536.1 hypothetical protein [Aliarcobacter butzleri]
MKNCDELQIIFPLDFERAGKMWILLTEYFKKKDISLKEFTEIKTTLNMAKRKKHFGFESNTLKISYGNVTNSEHSLLWIIKKDIEDIRFDFDEIINIIIQQFNILEIFLVNRKYKVWQNTTDIGLYQKYYGDISNLKLIDNGSPYPLNAIEIDISNNPGRRVIRDGYVEAVSSPMFVGEDFWNIVGTKKEELEKLDFLNISQINEKTIKIEIKNIDCFIDESTKDIQNKLRETLFGKDKI